MKLQCDRAVLQFVDRLPPALTEVLRLLYNVSIRHDVWGPRRSRCATVLWEEVAEQKIMKARGWSRWASLVAAVV